MAPSRSVDEEDEVAVEVTDVESVSNESRSTQSSTTMLEKEREGKKEGEREREKMVRHELSFYRILLHLL